MSIREGFRRTIAIGVVVCTALLGSLPAARAQPSWYKRKKQITDERKQEEAEKAAEKPVIGADAPPQDDAFSTLSKNTAPPPETNLLFKRAGVTEAVTLDYGNAKSNDHISGGTIAAQYSFGWWWTPRLILSPSARISGNFTETYVYMTFNIGPQIKYVLNKHFIANVYLGYGLAQGLARTSQEHVPPPPSLNELRARHGLWMMAGMSYYFWRKRDFGVGPTLSYGTGSMGDRTQSIVTLGITFQSGRPNYTGDVTSW